MANNTLVARSGQLTEADSTSGPGSYPTGGFSIQTRMGRVDQAIVEGDNGAYDYKLNSVASHNQIVVQAYSQGSGTEVAANTDLSGDTVTYTAYML